MPSIEESRAWYPTDDTVHGFDHVLRVHHMAQRLAISEGADLEIVLAAALLHDAQDDQQPGDENPTRQEHHLASADIAARVLQAEGWHAVRIAAVQHCIRAHRFRDNSEQPQTLEAKVLFDADKLDAIGAIGVARAISYAARDGQPVYVQPSQHFMQNGCPQAGEPHSAYHEYVYKLRKLKDLMYTRTGRTMAEERHQFMSDFFERLAEEISGER